MARADTPNQFCKFGLFRDGRGPKPTFETFRRLIVEPNAAAWPAG